MKKSIFYLLMFVFTLGLTVSCNNDDDSGSADIVGKWNLKQIGMIAENGNLTYVDVPMLCPGKNFLVVEFFADGTFHSEQYEEECEHDESTGTYVINGDILTIVTVEDGQPSSDTMNIKELTSTKLLLMGNDEEDGDFYFNFQRM